MTSLHFTKTFRLNSQMFFMSLYLKSNIFGLHFSLMISKIVLDTYQVYIVWILRIKLDVIQKFDHNIIYYNFSQTLIYCSVSFSFILSFLLILKGWLFWGVILTPLSVTSSSKRPVRIRLNEINTFSIIFLSSTTLH